MGYATIFQSAGAFTRAVGEYNLLTTENQKRLRVGNSLTEARSSEVNAISNEVDDSQRTSNDQYYDTKIADAAEQAAKWGMWSSIVGTAGSLCTAASSFGDGKTSKSDAIFGAVDALVNGTLTILGAVMTYLGTKEEKEMLQKQLSGTQNVESQDKKNLDALNGNPQI